MFFGEVEDFADHAFGSAGVDHVDFCFAFFSQKLFEWLGGEAFESVGAVFCGCRGWFGAEWFELVEEEEFFSGFCAHDEGEAFGCYGELFG